MYISRGGRDKVINYQQLLLLAQARNQPMMHLSSAFQNLPRRRMENVFSLFYYVASVSLKSETRPIYGPGTREIYQESIKSGGDAENAIRGFSTRLRGRQVNLGQFQEGTMSEHRKEICAFEEQLFRMKINSSVEQVSHFVRLFSRQF